MIELTPDLLRPYFVGKKTHAGYKTTAKLKEELTVHIDGLYPKKLIEDRRPHESKKDHEYRQKIYESPTSDPVNRVMSSLSKIRRSVDWSITHPIDEYPSVIPEDEGLDQYADINFPFTDSLENWLFTICFKNYAEDANAIILVQPLEFETEANEYYRPFPFIYNSADVLEYKEGKLLIARLDNDSEYEGQGAKKQPKRFLAANEDRITIWEESDSDYDMVEELVHGLGVLPAFKMGGTYFKTISKYLIYKSRLSPMVPRLNDCAREYSDLQAEVVLHIHSEKWEWATDACPQCKDDKGSCTGFVNNKIEGKIQKVVCPTCHGSKVAVAGQYQIKQVRATKENMGETKAPIPPFGYIEKSTDIVKIQDERVDNHIRKALESVNMGFMDQTPLNESGKAKEVDRDELNNFVHAVAKDLVRIMRNIYFFMGEWRHAEVIESKAERKSLMPSIVIPQKFDLLSSNYLADELKGLKESGVSPAVLAELELQYVNKKFYDNPEVGRKVMAILSLDPLSGLDADEKMAAYADGNISRQDYVLSSNVRQFVDLAIEQKDDFLELDTEVQRKALMLLVDDKIKVIDALAPEPTEGE